VHTAASAAENLRQAPFPRHHRLDVSEIYAPVRSKRDETTFCRECETTQAPQNYTPKLHPKTTPKNYTPKLQTLGAVPTPGACTPARARAGNTLKPFRACMPPSLRFYQSKIHFGNPSTQDPSADISGAGDAPNSGDSRHSLIVPKRDPLVHWSLYSVLLQSRDTVVLWTPAHPDGGTLPPPPRWGFNLEAGRSLSHHPPPTFKTLNLNC